MIDPYQILGVDRDAEDQKIRQAYLAAIRACPADRDPDRFKSYQRALEAIGTQRQRLAHALFDVPEPTAAALLLQIDHAATAPGRPTQAQFRAALGASITGAALFPWPDGGDDEPR